MATTTITGDVYQFEEEDVYLYEEEDVYLFKGEDGFLFEGEDVKPGDEGGRGQDTVHHVHVLGVGRQSRMQGQDSHLSSDVGSGFIWVLGSGSGFRIRIQLYKMREIR